MPSALRFAVPELGATNVVPVDFVADAMVHLVHQPGLDHRAFHLVHPRPQPLSEVYNALADALGAPKLQATMPTAVGSLVKRGAEQAARVPALAAARDIALAELDIPPEVLPHLTFGATFSSAETRRALEGTGIASPEIGDYARVLVDWWREHLDPNRHRRPGPAGRCRAGAWSSPAPPRASGARRRSRSRAPAACRCSWRAAPRSSRRSAPRSSATGRGRPGCTRATSPTASRSTPWSRR